MSEQPPDCCEPDVVHDALRSPGVPAVVDTKAGQPRLIPDADPEPVEPCPREVVAQFPDLVLLEVNDFEEPRFDQCQQADGGNRPGVFSSVPIEPCAEALQLRVIEVAGDGPARVLNDVGAGVRDMLADLAPLARRISKARLAAPGLSTLAASNHADTRAWSIASSLSPPELRHQAVAQVDVEGFERRWLPAVPEPVAVAGSEVADQRPQLDNPCSIN